jgi:hypothetical protein
MTRSLLRRAALSLVAFVLFAAPGALAQQPAGTRLVGRITAVAGDTLTVKTSAGKTLKIVLAPGAAITAAKPAKVADIKPGCFVGTAARPEANDRWRAIEVHIFPPGSRLGEGHRPWPPEPGATMTNADVTAAVVHTTTGALTLATGGKSYDIDVPHGTPIVLFEPGTRKELVKGAHVSVVQATPTGDGAFSVKSITVSSNPRWPPK